uniref:NB-ARC domain-containing protein n=1 Tax=Physcomitrium patens TaxID=3218 RepID=A0A7I4D799_PHYPA
MYNSDSFTSNTSSTTSSSETVPHLQMAEAVALTVLQPMVQKLLSAMMKEVALPEWNRNKHAEELETMLMELKPMVDNINPSTANRAVGEWLKGLRTRLDCLKHLLLDMKGNRFTISQFKNSRKLVKEKELLSKILSQASVVVLAVTSVTSANMTRLREENNERHEGLCSGIEGLLKLADATKRALDKSQYEYRNPEDLMAAISSITSEADDIHFTSTHTRALPEASTSTDMLRGVDSEMVFGGDGNVEDAKELLLDQNTHMVGFWASGGAGKTLAAQRVFDDDAIRAHFTGGCFWFTVGGDLSVRSLFLDLGKKINGPSEVRRNISMEDLTAQLCNELKDKKHMLVVLDDVWKEDVLRLVTCVVPLRAGCKILVTTRIEEVLDKNHATKLAFVLLDEENSWKLFCWQAFRGTSHVPPELEKLAKDVMGECGGLPLALKVIGSVFARKTDRGFWELCLQKLRNADVLDKGHETQLFNRLKVSFDELGSIDGRLQECFLYFAAFPEDWKVDVYKDLLPLWRAEGIVGQKYDPKLEACGLVGVLVSRSLIELKSNEWGGLYCMVHDILRDLARHIVQHEKAVTERECLYEAGREMKDGFPREWASSSDTMDLGRGRRTRLSVRRLSVMLTNLKELPSKLDAPELEVLLLRENPLECIPKRFFNNLRSIRVLDLRGTNLKALPEGVGELKSLAVLNLSGTGIETLPKSIGKLTGMEELCLDCCERLSHLPSKLTHLTRLRILKIFSNENLWRTGFWEGLPKMLRGKLAVRDLAAFVGLEHLTVESGFFDFDSVLWPVELLTASKRLQTLKLVGGGWPLPEFPELRSDDWQHLECLSLDCVGLVSIPDCVCSLPCLKSLTIWCSKLVSPPALDRLPNLVSLIILYCFNLETLPTSFGRKDGFPALVRFKLNGSYKLASLPELEDGAMPSLKSLHLLDLEKFDILPQSFAKLKNLQTLDLRFCSNLKNLEHEHLSFESFPNLVKLDVRGCQSLSELPSSLAFLPHFRLLVMGDGCNPSIPPELEVAVSNKKVIIKY